MSYSALFKELETKDSRKSGATLSVAGLSLEQSHALNAPFSQNAVICAGAGAGKTRLLVERVTALLQTGANPTRLGVVAFTRKSAAEIIKRVRTRLGLKAAQPICSTVHALAYSILSRENYEIALATPEQEVQALQGLNEFMPTELEGLSPAELLLLINRAREEFDMNSNAGLLGQVYEQTLQAAGLSDFTALLSQAAKTTRNIFDVLIVDEAQDLSQLQLKFLKSIGPKAVYWFIGDPDQAIYAFRGAHADMMHQLRSESPAVHFLTTNYRSAKQIVKCANSVIQANPRPFSVQWNAARDLTGLVTVTGFETAALEFERTRDWLIEDPKHRAVLGRTQALVAPYKALGLPAYTVHEAKGLEWQDVRVLGCEEGLFPHPMSGAQEERRLFYVAMTRARDSLELTFCERRSGTASKRRHPSRFLLETQVSTQA